MMKDKDSLQKGLVPRFWGAFLCCTHIFGTFLFIFTAK